ncbi:4114_t:CDS:2 [Racocetra persica]|uniref:4114_t:CDS:1 n=1 Tax=Racocetra persica TaxID=160502 RepID=A0ACA9KM67_9GLOM|nr:4114_t:CDS:2 [Racocetra persica]
MELGQIIAGINCCHVAIFLAVLLFLVVLAAFGYSFHLEKGFLKLKKEVREIEVINGKERQAIALLQTQVARLQEQLLSKKNRKTRNLTLKKVATDTCLPLYQLQELVIGKRDIDTDIAARLDRQEAVVKKMIRPYQETKQHGRTKTVQR